MKAGEKMEAEEAWDLFRANASNELRKSASVAGQLDTLAAQMQDIQTGVDRLTKLIPKFMGDDAAIDNANADAMPAENPLEGLVGGAGDEEAMPMEDEAPVEDVEGAPEEDADEVPPAEEPTEEDTVDKSDEEGPVNVLESGPEPEADDDDRSVGEILGITEDVSGAEPEEGPAEAPGADSGPEDMPDIAEDAETPAEGSEDAPVEEDVTEIEAEVPPEAPEMADDGGIQDIYAQILALLVQAASKAQDSGDADAVSGIMKSAGAIQSAYGDMCPYLDSVMGTDHFTKSFKEMNSMSDENELEKCGSNTEGTEMEKSITGAEAPDDMIEKSDVPAEFTETGADMEKSAETNMHDVEDEKGATPNGKTKVGPDDLSKSSHLTSFRDMMAKGCTNARIEDELEKECDGDMEKSASENMPRLPETGEDKSVGGMASEGAPDVPETGEDQSVTGSASTGMKDVIDPGSESSMQKSGDTPTQAEECDGALSKSMPGKRIMSFKDMMMKSAENAGRPDSISSANGDITTPTFGAPMLQKNADKPRVRMGPGVDPHEVVAADWEQYNLFKARAKY